MLQGTGHQLSDRVAMLQGVYEDNLHLGNPQHRRQARRPFASRRRQWVTWALLGVTLVFGPALAYLGPNVLTDGQQAELATEQQQIEVSIETDAWLLGDGGLLRSAVTNLMVNAIHHTPDGGRILLALQETPEGLRIRVQDTGEGIAAEHIPRLTERFYRVDAGRSRERGGTGLGLAIVKHALQKHGAKLEIESRIGEGSSFSCVFPRERRIPGPQ